MRPLRHRVFQIHLLHPQRSYLRVLRVGPLLPSTRCRGVGPLPPPVPFQAVGVVLRLDRWGLRLRLRRLHLIRAFRPLFRLHLALIQ